MAEKLDAKDFSPQSRPRLYLIGWHSARVAAMSAHQDLRDEARGSIQSQS